MDRTELAWAAGFWDGEGSAYLVGEAARRTKQPHARINQAGTAGIPEVLMRFHEVVGFGAVQGPDLPGGRQPLYRWVISRRADVERLGLLLAPWLGDVKRSQFSQVIGRSLGSDDGKGLPPRDELMAWCAGLFDGEGSTCLVRHGSHAGYFVLEANITQSSWTGTPQVLVRFREALQFGAIHGPYSGSEGHAPVYKWRCYRREQIEALVREMGAQLGAVKRRQATGALATVSAQPPLPRGNPAWGAHKTHCVKGHEYATARLRPFKGRGKNTEAPRASKQCLACLREYAARQRDAADRRGGFRAVERLATAARV